LAAPKRCHRVEKWCHSPARPKPYGNISRKGAKAQREIKFSELGVLGVLARDHPGLFGGEEDMKLEKAQLVIQGLKEAGVDFAAGVPDAQFIEVYKMLEEDPAIHYVGAANEAEATGIGFGAWFGGKKPALMLATSGLLVATYHLARINLLHEVPVLVVIPYRGDIGDPRWLGLYKKTTEPGLNAMDIPYRVVSRPENIIRSIKECNESARAWLKPVAVLLNEEALW
jgi:sulfopyruvate decarboxylase subunit alpha